MNEPKKQMSSGSRTSVNGLPHAGPAVRARQCAALFGPGNSLVVSGTFFCVHGGVTMEEEDKKLCHKQ